MAAEALATEKAAEGASIIAGKRGEENEWKTTRQNASLRNQRQLRLKYHPLT
jgi:hypothetical protein